MICLTNFLRIHNNVYSTLKYVRVQQVTLIGLNVFTCLLKLELHGVLYLSVHIVIIGLQNVCGATFTRHLRHISVCEPS